MKKTNTQKGITLIALIITIVVLLILAVVTINAIQGDGIIRYAENAANDYTAKANEEQDNLDTLLGQIEGSLIEEKISIETDCVKDKYYADVDGDKEPDGVIYIDIANTKSGSWQGNSYTITNVTTGLKEYYISKESHTTTEFGTAPVLSKVPGSTGEERFYVMALDSVGYYCWYYGALYPDGNPDYYGGEEGNGISDYATVTARGIGAGKTNTENMIAKWNSEAYGPKDANRDYIAEDSIDNYYGKEDMWGVVEDGWYIPSIEEWFACGSVLGGSFGGDTYWSSSLESYNSACQINFDLTPPLWVLELTYTGDVRLGATF